MLMNFLIDESGSVVSAELILVLTITFCAAAVGLSTIGSAVVSELNDVSEMIGSVSQTYNYTGIQAPRDNGKFHGRCSGAGFNDRQDDCDCEGIVLVTTCGKTQTATVAASADTNVEG